MRNYEVAYIVHPDLDEDAFNGINERVAGWIADADGKIVKTDLWGKRKLAYEIRKQTEGQYVLLTAELEPAATEAIERNLRLQESIMRFMITAVEAEVEVEAPAEKAAPEAATEVEAEAEEEVEAETSEE